MGLARGQQGMQKPTFDRLDQIQETLVQQQATIQIVAEQQSRLLCLLEHQHKQLIEKLDAEPRIDDSCGAPAAPVAIVPVQAMEASPQACAPSCTNGSPCKPEAKTKTTSNS